MLKSFLCGLVRELEQGNVGEDSVDLGDCLLTMSAGSTTGRRVTAANHAPPAPVLLGQIKAFIDAHLPDPGLRPDVIASAHFISSRYLHKLFEAESATVSRWIREQRLDRCRNDLADQRLDRQTVSTIRVSLGPSRSVAFQSRLPRALRPARLSSPARERLRRSRDAG